MNASKVRTAEGTPKTDSNRTKAIPSKQAVTNAPIASTKNTFLGYCTKCEIIRFFNYRGFNNSKDKRIHHQ